MGGARLSALLVVVVVVAQQAHANIHYDATEQAKQRVRVAQSRAVDKRHHKRPCHTGDLCHITGDQYNAT